MMTRFSHPTLAAIRFSMSLSLVNASVSSFSADSAALTDSDEEDEFLMISPYALAASSWAVCLRSFAPAKYSEACA